MLLGHHDTVFPAGSAARLGFAVRDGRARGPGVADMKGGLVLGLAALEALAAGERRFAAVDFVSVPDEETRPAGPPDGLERIRGADACLVLECARENGDLVYQRKAQASLTLVARGRSAHAGTHPERGRSALLALCREALRVDALNGARPGLTVTVGTLHSGTHFATVPDRAEADVDVRAWDADDVGWALDQVRDTGVHDGVSFDVGRLSRWPGMAPTAVSLALLETAEALGPRLGTPVGRRRTGGSSDGCCTAAAGIPTLDGLGPIGGHDHSPDEYIDIDSWPARCGLLAGVISAVPGAAAGACRAGLGYRRRRSHMTDTRDPSAGGSESRPGAGAHAGPVSRDGLLASSPPATSRPSSSPRRTATRGSSASASTRRSSPRTPSRA